MANGGNKPHHPAPTDAPAKPAHAAKQSSTRPSKPAAAKGSKIEERLSEVHADDLSPREALDLIYELKALMTPGSN